MEADLGDYQVRRSLLLALPLILILYVNDKIFDQPVN